MNAIRLLISMQQFQSVVNANHLSNSKKAQEVDNDIEMSENNHIFNSWYLYVGYSQDHRFFLFITKAATYTDGRWGRINRGITRFGWKNQRGKNPSSSCWSGEDPKKRCFKPVASIPA